MGLIQRCQIKPSGTIRAYSFMEPRDPISTCPITDPRNKGLNGAAQQTDSLHKAAAAVDKARCPLTTPRPDRPSFTAGAQHTVADDGERRGESRRGIVRVSCGNPLRKVV